jgi:apolipoprotein N-acyltransferase
MWLAFPGLWLLADWVRSIGVFGFPWGVTPYAVASLPHLLQFAEYTGTWGVGLWIALVNGLVFGCLTMERVRPQMVLGALLVVLLLAPFLHGRSVLRNREPQRAVRVGLLQPNVGKNKWERAVRDSVVGVLLGQTKALSVDHQARPPALIVWPETAIPARLPREPIYRWQVESLVNEMDIPLLAGFPDGVRVADGTWTTSNSAGLFLPDSGMVGRYDKRKLVPFSEYMPVPLLNRVDFGQASFTKGDEPGVFDQVDPPFGVLICFESIFPDPSRELVAGGARYLVNITNDQWFGDSPAPYQHFAMNGLRCIENRVGMARAANTGISASIDPYGFVRDATPTFVEERLVVHVELGRGPTFYTRHGDWIVGVALLLPLAGFLPGIRETSA